MDYEIITCPACGERCDEEYCFDSRPGQLGCPSCGSYSDEDEWGRD